MTATRSCALVLASLLAVATICGAQTMSTEALIDNLPVLSPEQSKTEALSRYAWGFFLYGDRAPDVDKVAEAYLAAIIYDPRNDFLIKELISLWSDTASNSENDKIVSYLTPLAHRHPSAAGLNLVVANACMREGNFIRAEVVLENLLAAVGWTDSMVVRQLVFCYTHTDQTDKAETLLQQALRANRLAGEFAVEFSAATFYNVMATDLTRQVSRRVRSKWQEMAYLHALRAVESAGTYRHDDVMVLASMFQRVGFRKEAATILEVLAEQGAASEQSDQMLAELYESLDKQRQAMEVWQRLAESQPFNHLFHDRLGRLLVRANRHRTATGSFERAYRLTLEARYARQVARLCLNTGQSEKALRYVGYLPPSARSLLLKSRALHQLQRYDLALNALQAIPETAKLPERERIEVHLLTAAAHYELGDFKAAVSAAEAAYLLDQNDISVCNLLGYMLAEADMDLARAEQLVRKSLSGSPANADFLDSLAWVLFRQGRLRTAARAIEEALDIDGDVRDPIKLDHAGDIFMALDDTDRAAVYWNQALDAAIDEDMNIQWKLQRLLSPER